MRSLFSHRSGLTLIETLVAMFILVVSFLGFYRLSVYTISQINSADQRLMALNYAVEGLEVVRNMRDGMLRENPAGGWDDFIQIIAISESGDFVIRHPDGDYVLEPLDGADENKELWEEIIPTFEPDEISKYESWRFYRKILIENGPDVYGDQLKKVQVIVGYEQRGIEDRIEFSTYLGNISLISKP